MTHRASEGVSFDPPSDLDLAYLAGLLDGEGYFGAGTRFKATGRNRGLPCIRVSMIDPAPLHWCAEHFGGKFTKKGRSARGRVVYEWGLHRQEDLRCLLPLLLPYLKVKGLQAYALLRVVELLLTQPRYSEPTNLLRGSRERKFAERARRRSRRLLWRAEVAQAQDGVKAAREALSNVNPATA